MQEKFLERHDRNTAGIPRPFPLIHNLPLRFTNHKDRDLGAFKNSQCVLVGWELPAAEEERISNTQENEITLQVMPTALHVKLLRPKKEFTTALGNGRSRSIRFVTNTALLS